MLRMNRLTGLACASVLLLSCVTNPSPPVTVDNPEPGLQGQWVSGDTPGAILDVPYSQGVRLVGHNNLWGRDSNVQLAWVDHCAYVSSTAGPFPIIGTMIGDRELTGVAVVDVSDPANPRAVRLLRDNGSIAALEAMHAVSNGDRKVLVAGAYHGGANTAGSSGGHDPDASPAWLSIYDVSDCTNPRLTAEVAWPENAHSLSLSPDGRLVYGPNLSPFTGEGGMQVMDISDLSNPKFLGKFPATRADGSSFEFSSHEVSFSKDGRRLYAGVTSSKSDDFNHGIPLMPPSAKLMGPEGGGVYIFDNSDFIDARQNPELRLISSIPAGGWHSVVPANINGKPHLVGGAELTACPGTWPKITNIVDESSPEIVGEFRLAMNYKENCPEPDAMVKASGGIIPPPGTATLHYNAVDSAEDTRLGLFQFLWAGLRIADLTDPENPREIAYFKPGDACGGHVRYERKSGHIWLSCGSSGFYVLALQPGLLPK